MYLVRCILYYVRVALLCTMYLYDVLLCASCKHTVVRCTIYISYDVLCTTYIIQYDVWCMCVPVRTALQGTRYVHSRATMYLVQCTMYVLVRRCMRGRVDAQYTVSTCTMYLVPRTSTSYEYYVPCTMYKVHRTRTSYNILYCSMLTLLAPQSDRTYTVRCTCTRT